MNRHDAGEAAGFQQRHANHRAHLSDPIGGQHILRAWVDLRILHDIRPTSAHRAQAFRAEVSEAIATYDARRIVVVVAGDIECVLVRFDVGIRAAIHFQVLAEMKRRGLSDLGRLDQGARRIVERQ